MKNIKYLQIVFAVLISSSLITSCKKEFLDTTKPAVAAVATDVNGLMNLAAGLHRRYSLGRVSPLYNTMVCGGYSTLALKTPNAGNISEAEIETGQTGLPKGNSIVTSMWRECLLLKAESETILDNINVALIPGDKVGLKSYASIFYALSVGTLCEYYEKVPLTTEPNATFSDRATALLKVVTILESADADLATTAPSTKFTGKIPAGIDIKNTVKALLARFYNMHSMVTGTYNAASGTKAITFAGAASTTVKSEFRFTTATRNEIAFLSTTVFVHADSSLGLKNGLAVTPYYNTDPRTAFYLNNAGGTLFVKGFFTTTTTSIPVYLPGEMQLIIAENQARQNAFPLSKIALDAVRTKTTDIYGIGANQPAYSGTLDQPNLLKDIYKQRRLEMFMSGMELEDSRRFGRPGPLDPNKERNRNFYPYPLIESDNNTNTPADPAI
jgi:starch-binding outer membrane protein, SusD/RagB family